MAEDGRGYVVLSVIILTLNEVEGPSDRTRSGRRRSNHPAELGPGGPRSLCGESSQYCSCLDSGHPILRNAYPDRPALSLLRPREFRHRPGPTHWRCLPTRLPLLPHRAPFPQEYQHLQEGYCGEPRLVGATPRYRRRAFSGLDDCERAPLLMVQGEMKTIFARMQDQRRAQNPLRGIP